MPYDMLGWTHADYNLLASLWTRPNLTRGDWLLLNHDHTICLTVSYDLYKKDVFLFLSSFNIVFNVILFYLVIWPRKMDG